MHQTLERAGNRITQHQRHAKFLKNFKSFAEVSKSDIEKLNITPNTVEEIYSYGDIKSRSGGKFQLYHENIKVCTVEWSWENETSDLQVLDLNKDYRYDLGHFEKNSKYLRSVKLAIEKFRELEDWEK